MQYKLPPDVKRQCLAIVHGYERRERWYFSERRKILNSSPAGYITYTDNGVECRQYLPHTSGAISDVPYDKVSQLENLENSTKRKQNRAIDDARLSIGADIESEELRQRLMKAIMTNCMEPRKYPYEYLGLDGIGRRDFYYRRAEFLYNIAVILDLA